MDLFAQAVSGSTGGSLSIRPVCDRGVKGKEDGVRSSKVVTELTTTQLSQCSFTSNSFARHYTQAQRLCHSGCAADFRWRGVPIPIPSLHTTTPHRTTGTISRSNTLVYGVMGEHILFFYGTLMAPQILHRVIHGSPDPEPWQRALLTFKPAVLHGYRRHRVRGADYPGIVADRSADGAASVLGTVVSGLTDGDIHRLDIFEGAEYEKGKVSVRILRESLDRQEGGPDGKDTDRHLRDVLDAAGAEFADEGEEVEAATYVYVAGKGRLEDGEWDFEAFKRDKMAWWVSADESEW
ncbi:AIG2-like family-domain-containing protein [Aspergillus coremiiformis]|uniref:Putative gamma-glutamylcyclotransferase n=1 Tax=Aspergillus coremiiformis TaxID=138285 RepID=A0A5N6ZDN4_9EURO|nr:AIG2-like family-domain-containing protein [Aspergillus coremiiformis]